MQRMVSREEEREEKRERKKRGREGGNKRIQTIRFRNPLQIYSYFILQHFWRMLAFKTIFSFSTFLVGTSGGL